MLPPGQEVGQTPHGTHPHSPDEPQAWRGGASPDEPRAWRREAMSLLPCMEGEGLSHVPLLALQYMQPLAHGTP